MLLAHEALCLARSARVATLVGQIAGQMLAVGSTPRNVIRAAEELVDVMETRENFALRESAQKYAKSIQKANI